MRCLASMATAASSVACGSMVVTWPPLRDSIVLTFIGRLPGPDREPNARRTGRISNADMGREFRRVATLDSFVATLDSFVATLDSFVAALDSFVAALDSSVATLDSF